MMLTLLWLSDVIRLGFLLGWVLATFKNVSDKNGIFFDAVNYLMVLVWHSRFMTLAITFVMRS